MRTLTTRRHGVYTHYLLDDKRHRSNGPAWDRDDKTKGSWWLYGNVHRYYGPAESWSNNWYLYHERVK